MTPTQKLTSEQDAIKQAIEAGWQKPKPTGFSVNPTDFDEYAVLDPALWQALGKARGWSDTPVEIPIWNKQAAFDLEGVPGGNSRLGFSTQSDDVPVWLFHAMRYFKVRLSGGDTQTYWQNLP